MFDLKFHSMINNAYTRLTNEKKNVFINDSQVRNPNIINSYSKYKFIDNYLKLTPEIDHFTEYFNSFVLYFDLLDYVKNFDVPIISNHYYSKL
jgi:hypothetical protein